MARPNEGTWAVYPTAERNHASSSKNARSRVAVARHALEAADPTGSRARSVDSDSEVLRGTFRISIPLCNYPGRTKPFALTLNYAARLWMGDWNMAKLDGDMRNAPGWSLSLPRILGGILI